MDTIVTTATQTQPNIHVTRVQDLIDKLIEGYEVEKEELLSRIRHLEYQQKIRDRAHFMKHY